MLYVIAAAALAVLVVRFRTLFRLLRAADGDPLRAIALLAIRRLPSERREWGSAMLAEMDHAPSRAVRRRFVLGCVWAALVAPPTRTGRTLRWTLCTEVAAVAAMAVFTLVRYPDLLRLSQLPMYLIVLVAVLVIYVWEGYARWGDGSTASVVGAHFGLALAAAGGVMLLLAVSQGWRAVALLTELAILVSGTAAAAVVGRSLLAGLRASLWAALLLSPLLVIVSLAIAYADTSGAVAAVTPSLFAGSGFHSIKAYALADNLTFVGALLTLTIVPVLLGVIGALGAGAGTAIEAVRTHHGRRDLPREPAAPERVGRARRRAVRSE